MQEPISAEQVRQLVGVELSDEDAKTLAYQSASQARNVAAFPQSDLRLAEPPLRSMPGPMQ